MTRVHDVEVGTVLTCPSWAQGREPEILGCGGEFIYTQAMRFDDDWVDCPHCGIMFAPEQGVKEPV